MQTPLHVLQGLPASTSDRRSEKVGGRTEPPAARGRFHRLTAARVQQLAVRLLHGEVIDYLDARQRHWRSTHASLLLALSEAAEHTGVLQHATGDLGHRHPWLGRAAIFSVTMANGAPDTVPPLPPQTSPDPVVRIAKLLIEAELTMAGRVEEALDRVGTTARPDLGPISDLAQVFQAVALLLAGRPSEALPWVERARGAAAVLNAPTTATAAAALRAEIVGDTTGLPPRPSVARGVSDVLLLRAYTSRGDAEARGDLRKATVALAMPGLMIET